ncbi:urea ABC transporter permease subunit UrtB [Nocardiopsis sp. MG754419]|uniref:urea ABC transporter permease subunit UrtB n=1 Tax=Nocardiopsis sp. MG754419 TaxID=2259865 RepID=UPI001BA6822C|nr:urea ABC transporter permease subunit UrtB [Nocardiopsis sp. MG754419]MBR8745206.1 urea ABC transporter permease subunit UrtB [Nocardiopsis sp. MG754419]
MEVLDQLPIGLAIGAVLLLAALGLNFTFGQMGVINMAHGEFIMIGAYTAFVLHAWAGLGSSHALLVALPVAFAVTGTLGWLLEAGLIRHFYGRPLDTLLLTFGIGMILQQAARDTFGAPNVDVPAPDWLTGGITLFDSVRIHHSRLFILALALVSVVAIALYLHRSTAGRQMRAVIHNRDLAAVSGVDTRRVDATTFFIGSGLAGIAGVALTLIGPTGPTLGTNYIVDAFLVVVIGGLGQLRGTVVAAFALGLLNATVEAWADASLAKLLVFATIVAFLQARPQGLFTVKSRALT